MANRTAVIETNKGTIKFELLEADAELDFERDEEFHVLQRGPVLVIGARDLEAERQPVAEHLHENAFDARRDVF